MRLYRLSYRCVRIGHRSRAAVDFASTADIAWRETENTRAAGFKERRTYRATGTCRKKEVLFDGCGWGSDWLSDIFFFIVLVSDTKSCIRQLQEIGKTGSSVTVIYWAYAQKQNAMSVELDMSAVKGGVSFAAVDKERRDIPVTVEFSQSGTYILKLDSVQQDFQAVSLRVTVQDKTIRLYTNEGQVDHVDELTFYSDLDGYYQARIKRNILELEQEIQQVKDSIQQWDEEISSYKEQIAQTKARLPYLSQKQRTDAQNSITAWEKQIEDCQGQQKEANEQISQLTDEINAQKNMISEEGVSELDKKCNEEEMKQNVSESDTQKEWEEHR